MINKITISPAKYRELEARMTALEKANEALRAENLALKSKNKVPRVLLHDMANPEVAKKIFGIEAKDGKIVRANDDRTNTNFQSFYQSLFRYVAPTIYTDPNTGKERIVYKRIKALSDEEYNILIELLEVVIDTMHFAQTKLAACKERSE